MFHLFVVCALPLVSIAIVPVVLVRKLVPAGIDFAVCMKIGLSSQSKITKGLNLREVLFFIYFVPLRNNLYESLLDYFFMKCTNLLLLPCRIKFHQFINS